MKKKIINGILLVAMLFAATTSFVSCKDNVDDNLLRTRTNSLVVSLLWRVRLVLFSLS